MTVEFLYPELCNLYGDRGNMDYLRRCLPAEYRETAMGAEPWFVRHDVDLIYLCSMTERSQQRVIDALRPYRARLAELMQQGTHFLLTGNAMEVFGKTIQDGETAIEGLGLLDLTARRILPKRANSLFLGDFEGKKIVGYTSRFSHMESSLPPAVHGHKRAGSQRRRRRRGRPFRRRSGHLPAGAAAGAEPRLHPLAAGRPGRNRRTPGLRGGGAPGVCRAPAGVRGEHRAVTQKPLGSFLLSGFFCPAAKKRTPRGCAFPS